MPTLLCRRHHLPSAGDCPGCADALCEECLRVGDGRCGQCSLHHRDTVELASWGRESRAEMRRVGIAVRRRPGDPIVLVDGPLHRILPLLGVLGLATAAAVICAEVDVRWGVDVTLTVVGLAVLIGAAVRRLFGGVSREAGLAAMLVVVSAASLGRWYTGEQHGPALAAITGSASDWVVHHGLATIGCEAAAALIAYAVAAGRRVG